MAQLTPENYSGGFLVDDDLMGGVSRNPDQDGHFTAFVLQHTTGEYLGYQSFADLNDALQAINQIQRSWTFERLGGCGGCADGGGCGAGSCGKGACQKGACAVPTTPS